MRNYLNPKSHLSAVCILHAEAEGLKHAYGPSLGRRYYHLATLTEDIREWLLESWGAGRCIFLSSDCIAMSQTKRKHSVNSLMGNWSCLLGQLSYSACSWPLLLHCATDLAHKPLRLGN